MSEEIKSKKISDLPEAKTIEGLYSLGVDNNGYSVKVPIEMLKGNKGEKGEVTQEELDTKADIINEEGRVARRKQNGFVLNPSELRKYDIEIDSNGLVGFFRTSRIGYGLIDSNTDINGFYKVDSNGWVQSGTDWKGRDLRNTEISQFIPSLYNIEVDLQGNVRYCYKSHSINESAKPQVVPDKLSDCFSNEVTIIEDSLHYAFPGICAGKSGVLHAFFRKGLYHTGIDGQVMYAYSLDYGKTWKVEETTLVGGDEIDGWFGDWRDAKAIRMSNGKFMLSQTKNYAKENGGVPPYQVDYDVTKCKTYGIIYNELASGILDIANPQIVTIPAPPEAGWIFGAGGLVEHNGIIYVTAYGGTPNAAYLFKSTDFGIKWETVSKISNNYNENSLAFIGDTMYCILRNVGGNALIVKSNDFGITWEYIRHLDTYYHGMYALGLGDTIMIAGRSLGSNTIIQFMDKNGNFVLNPIGFGKSGDSSYADICTFENYVHIIYYSQLSATNWGIFTRKIERNKLQGLSYQ